MKRRYVTSCRRNDSTDRTSSLIVHQNIHMMIKSIWSSSYNNPADTTEYLFDLLDETEFGDLLKVNKVVVCKLNLSN